ncbi:hypothetical protein FRB93_014016 [Tulasnella sp. JGI-2019a]|nr:hypothetical protein FRB93_014016 [Tulasnella sp. JGI-2019a]
MSAPPSYPTGTVVSYAPPPAAAPPPPHTQSPPPQQGMYSNLEKGGSGELPQQPYVPNQQNPYGQPAPPPAAAPPLNTQGSFGPNMGGYPSPGGTYPQAGPGSPHGTYNGYPQHTGATYHQNSFNSAAGDRGMQPGMQQQQQWAGGPNQMGQQQPMPYGTQMGPMMTGGAYGMTPDMQCQQQGHLISSSYGVVGLISAILLFPCGIIICMMDQKEQCSRCRHVFKHGILD